MPRATKRPAPSFTVPPVWREIIKKNERQGTEFYDVLVCGHAVLADRDNTYRRAGACPECRLKVQQYADQHRVKKTG